MSKRGKKTELYGQLLKTYYAHRQELGIHIPTKFVLTEIQEEVLELMSEMRTQKSIASDLCCHQSGVAIALKAGIKKIRSLDIWAKEKADNDDAQCPVNQRKIQEAAMDEVTRKWKAKQELEAATKYNWDESGYIKVPSAKELRGEE